MSAKPENVNKKTEVNDVSNVGKKAIKGKKSSANCVKKEGISIGQQKEVQNIYKGCGTGYYFCRYSD